MFLRSLPADCYFNVIGFGTHYETLFPNSVRYSQETLNKAVDYAQSKPKFLAWHIFNPGSIYSLSVKKSASLKATYFLMHLQGR